MPEWNGQQVAVVVTNGQSFGDLAEKLTLAREYGPAIANFNNMAGQDITWQRFYIRIPTNWLKETYASATTVQMPPAIGTGATATSIIPGVPNWALALGVAAALWVAVK